MRGWEEEGWVSEELGVRMEMNIKIHKVLEELIKYYIFKNIKEEADWWLLDKGWRMARPQLMMLVTWATGKSRKCGLETTEMGAGVVNPS